MASATAIPYSNLDPASFDAQLLLARQMRDQNKQPEALAAYQRAITIKPNDLHAQFELGHLLHVQNDFYGAIEHYRASLTQNENNPTVLYNLGDAYRKVGNMKQARTCYEELLKHQPTNPHLQYGLAECCLMLGDYKTGFAAFEWRWRRAPDRRNFSENVWTGGNPAGKTLLLRAEYGQGDTIQFIRYAQELKKQGATIIAEVQHSLVPLLSLCPYIDKLIIAADQTERSQLPAHDAQLPIMSLPHLFGTTLETVPNATPYLHADKKLASEWRNKLSRDKKIKVGICWSVNPYFESFKSPLSQKGMPLAMFAELAQLENISLYSLQQIDGVDQLNNLPDGMMVHTFGEDFDKTHGRFMDTAAVIENLDLVITVDTSIAHLAGALNKPVWVLLPYVADWRWMQNRSDSPWYPTMRLFRQADAQNWRTVMQDVVRALKNPNALQKPATAPLQKATAKKRSGAVFAEISHGELIDKITILEIKRANVKDQKKLANIEKELAELMATYRRTVVESPELLQLKQDLYDINLTLWDLEDDVREKDKLNSFGRSFVKLARSVYLTNDRRAEVKRAINDLLSSPIIEEKSHAKH